MRTGIAGAMNDREKSDRAKQEREKAERLAEQLRANLRRRKQQARALRGSPKDG